MNDFEQRLNQSRRGNGILFCGAGFTSDCLNFTDPDHLGVTTHLLRLLNDWLEGIGATTGYQDVRNAADAARTHLGEHVLMQRLQDRFTLKQVPEGLVDVLRFPWAKIYTTNFDNGIELGLNRAGRRFTPFNNLDTPDSSAAGTPVIHLHGFAEKWGTNTFSQSCVLGGDAYLRLDAVHKWLLELKFDLERAEIVTFVGFSAKDFHLDNVFFHASGLKEKAFFVNRSCPNPDPDELMNQNRFGKVLYISRDGLASIVRDLLATTEPREPPLASYMRYTTAQPSSSVPAVKDIENLFLYGNFSAEHAYRDMFLAKSEYHVLRSNTKEILHDINTGGRIFLITGDICDGKTIFLEQIKRDLSISRPVFDLRTAYDDLLNETASILEAYPNAVLAVENCFDIKTDRLAALARNFSNGDPILLLTARDISAEGEISKLTLLKVIPTFRHVKLRRLDETESKALAELVDQIGGWVNSYGASSIEKYSFIVRSCNASMPRVLLEILKSPYVQDKYREDFNRLAHFPVKNRRAIILALYIAHIGHSVASSFLSEIFEFDAEDFINSQSALSGHPRFLRVNRGSIETVPAIGARNILAHIVEDSEIVDTIVTTLTRMSELERRTDSERHIFTQMMRYSILSSVVHDVRQHNVFFDHVSKISYFRNEPLFWLQWHMAKIAQQEFLDAEKFLENGYRQADLWDRRRTTKYNRHQLDDRKAKFLMLRARTEERKGADLFRDFRGAITIIGRLFNQKEVTHHPFETLGLIFQVFENLEHSLLGGQSQLVKKAIGEALSLATTRRDRVPDGYQARKADDALQTMRTFRNELEET